MRRKALTAEEAAERVPDGATVMIGGFLGVGSPRRVIDALVARGAKGLTVIGNDTGRPEIGIGRLVVAGCVKKVIVSHIGTNPVTQQKMMAGEMEVELVPQGTLAERIRAGGSGIGGFFTPTGYGTPLADGKETRVIDGRGYVFEHPIVGDVALVKAYRADRMGNLVYRKTSRNFGPVMAMASARTIAQVMEVVDVGQLDPEVIVTPSIFTHTVVTVPIPVLPREWTSEDAE